jgi:putative membrane protein
MEKISRIAQLFAVLLLMTSISAASAIAKPAPKLTDPEIASAAVMANQVDIDHALIALKRSDNSSIRKFALDMVRDHTTIIQQAVALAKKLGVTPKSNAVTKSLMKGDKKVSKMLKSKWKKAFNKAYINNEVTYHKAVIKDVKNVLIPQTKNKQLKSLLKKVVPVLKQHLKMAENAQKKISGSGSSDSSSMY